MEQIIINVNGRDYKVGCDSGQEEHVRELARYVDSHIAELVKSAGQVGDARLLLLASLILADELSETIAHVEELEEEIEELRSTETDLTRSNNEIEGKVADILEAAAKRIEDLTDQMDVGPPAQPN